jgi:hypothetical protein
VLSARYRLVECASVILFFHVAPAPALLSSSTLFPSSSYEIFKRKEVWKKEKTRTRIFSQSRGPGAVQPVVVLFAHKKLFYAPCVVVLYTLFLGTISCKAAGAGPSARIMDCKHSLTVKVLHTTQQHSPAFCVSGVGTAMLGVVPRYLSKNLCTCGVGILVVDYRREMPRGIKHKSCAAILDI